MKGPPASIRPAGGALLQGVLLSLAVLAAYAPSLRAPFVFDDFAAVSDNPTIRRLGDWAAVLSPPDDGRAVTGRPFVNLTLAVNHAISGEATWSYHLFNFGVHLLAALVLWRLLRRVLPDATLAWAVAGLWSLHPLLTEAVSCIAQRTESLAGLLMLVTLFGFVRAVEAPVLAGRWLALAWAASVAGMATKEVVAVVPLLVFLYDRTFLAGSFREAWIRRWRWHGALALTWLLLGWLVWRSGGARGTAAGFASGVSAWGYLKLQAAAIVHYLRLVFWPHPLVLDYGSAAPVALADVWWQGTLVIALLALTLWAWARRPAAGYAGAWCFIILAPSSSLIPLAAQPVAEHRMYLPLAAILALLGGAAWARLGRRVLGPLLGLGLVAGLATAQRNATYRTELGLWADTVEHAPDNPRALGNFGTLLLEAGRNQEAAAVLERALTITPDQPELLGNLCAAESRLGRLAEAVGHGERAVRLAPEQPRFRENLAYALFLTGNAAIERRDLPAAMAALRRAAELDASDPAIHTNYANTLLLAGRVDDAIAEYREVLRRHPGDARAQTNLQRALELRAAR
ncbi:MAG TPA: tetratricopeptide repeat protein [Lacunisphaera sp.]|jgi:Flp pilus assembly protein TadD|nr:tetratricopeptide repeat protein [Lacunisphaera sp.]